MKENYSDKFFNVSSSFGFLPEKNPLTVLPTRYEELQSLLDNMPVNLANGSKGYLAIPNRIKIEVDKLPNYLNDVKKETEILVIQALYRGYCFLASAYTLEL